MGSSWLQHKQTQTSLQTQTRQTQRANARTNAKSNHEHHKHNHGASTHTTKHNTTTHTHTHTHKRTLSHALARATTSKNIFSWCTLQKPRLNNAFKFWISEMLSSGQFGHLQLETLEHIKALQLQIGDGHLNVGNARFKMDVRIFIFVFFTTFTYHKRIIVNWYRSRSFPILLCSEQLTASITFQKMSILTMCKKLFQT